MKWNTILGSMVVALGLCTQSFGFDLLDRMLGANGCGCEVSCCTTAAPSCAAPAGPTCAAPIGPTCAAPIGPTCAAPAPTCGAEPTCAAQPCDNGGCCHKRRCGLNLKGLLGHRHCCKPVVSCGAPACAAPTCAAPTCGVEPTCAAQPCCDNGCRRPCFLHRLFACKSKCCGAPACGTPACAAPTCGIEPNYGVAPEGKELPPMPPVPMDMQ